MRTNHFYIQSCPIADNSNYLFAICLPPFVFRGGAGGGYNYDDEYYGGPEGGGGDDPYYEDGAGGWGDDGWGVSLKHF